MPKSKVRKSDSNKKGPTPPKKRTPSAKELGKQRIREQATQLQGALLHMRQLYDETRAENAELRSGVTQRDYMLTALAVRYGNHGMLDVPEVDIQAVAQGEYAGYNVTNKDGIITIEALEPEFDGLHAVEDDEEDEEDEDDAGE